MPDSDDPLHQTATELRMATFRLARRLRRERANDALSDAQLAVLAALRMHGRHTLTALAERERVTPPSMTNLVNGMAELGYVVRVPDEDDRRRVHVELTPAGDEIVVATIRRRDAVLGHALEELDFTPEELQTLRDASALMRKVAER